MPDRFRLPFRSLLAIVAVVIVASSVTGCAGFEARTQVLRSSLDAGNTRAAINHLNKELGVKSDEELPNKIDGEGALLVLDRATVQLSDLRFANSKRDFEAADKVIEMIDFSRTTGDSLATYLFSDSAGKYMAPPHEKLLINALNIINYLELNDLNGAKIEARRLAVMQKYYRDTLKKDSAILGFGGFLAGFVFEKAGDPDEALRWYDEALKFSNSYTVQNAVISLAQQSNFRTPRINTVLKNALPNEPVPSSSSPATPSTAPAEQTSKGDDKADNKRDDKSGADNNPSAPAKNDSEQSNIPVNPPAKSPAPEPQEGELLVIMGYGRVPHKIPKRIPIGLALTLVANDISPANSATASKLAAQGLVTWINYPELAPERGGYEIPKLVVDGRLWGMEESVNISSQVRAAWQEMEGKVILAAITRMITRAAVGQGIQAAAGRDSIAGLLLSWGTQAAMTAADTPDTRSWETLPARIAIARVKLPVGRHKIIVSGRGISREQTIVVEPGGWQIASLLALR